MLLRQTPLSWHKDSFFLLPFILFVQNVAYMLFATKAQHRQRPDRQSVRPECDRPVWYLLEAATDGFISLLKVSSSKVFRI